MEFSVYDKYVDGDFMKDLVPLLFGDISLDMFAAFIHAREICLQLENDA